MRLYCLVAGACSTATHGSGERNGNLATAVSALELVNASGDVVTLSREKSGETFLGSVVGLGALGAISKITFDVRPTFQMQQYVYENLPLSEMKNHFDAIQSAAYSVSLFTDWQNERINEVWLKKVVQAGRTSDAPAEFLAQNELSRTCILSRSSAENCTKKTDGRARPLV